MQKTIPHLILTICYFLLQGDPLRLLSTCISTVLIPSTWTTWYVVIRWFLFLSKHDDVIKWKHFHITGPLCGEFTGPCEFPTQKPVTWSFDVFFDLRLKRLSKQPWGWWFETPSSSLWRQLNGVLTHWDRDKMAAISQTIFSDVFSWMKSVVFWLKFHWSLFLRVQLTIT